MFQHHPWFLPAFDEKKGYVNIHPRVRQRFFALFAKYDVSAVFAGHYHRNALARHGATERTTTSAVGRQLGEDKSGFRAVQRFALRLARYHRADDGLQAAHPRAAEAQTQPVRTV